MLDKVQIFNAADLQDVGFACYLDAKTMKPQAMKASWYANTLTLVPDTGSTLKFSAFHSIHYGEAGKDVNLCAPDSFKYRTVNGLPDISKVSSVTIELSNMMGLKEAYPNLELKLRVMDNGILNVKWNYKLD